MRHLIGIVLLLAASLRPLPAATLSDVKILSASENIKYLAQNIAKNYLYFYLYPEKQYLQEKIYKSIENLEKNIRTIAVTTKAEKTKELLDFFSYEKEQIKSLLSQKPNDAHTYKILDFSEALTEGAKNISNSIKYRFSFEEKMFMHSKNIEYLIEEMAKYYMVLGSSIDQASIMDKLNHTTTEIDKELKTINQYQYPKTLNGTKKDINRLWDANKHFFIISKSAKIPSVVLLATHGLQNYIEKIAIHHSRGE